MILKALYDYYQRSENLAPEGKDFVEIGFLILIDEEGNFKRLEDRRSEDRKSCQKFLVAKPVVRTIAPKANLLWDNSRYVLGISEEDFREKMLREKIANGEELTEEQKRDLDVTIPKTKAKNGKTFECFRSLVYKIAESKPEKKSITAVKKFYENFEANLEEMSNDQLWPSVQKDIIKNLSFFIDGDLKIIAEDDDLIKFLSTDDSISKNLIKRYCLVTGDEMAEPVRVSAATPILGGKSNGKLVAFQTNSGYDSYGKEQGYNAPISTNAEFAYSTALNCLLGRDSRNKFSIGSRTYVFWASSNDEPSKKAEEGLFSMLGFDKTTKDNPNKGVDTVKQVFKDLFSGKMPTGNEDYFYILGLAPNSARIAVVYWSEQTVKEFAGNILRHFDDMEIVDNRKPENAFPYFGIHSMMSSITLGGKSSDVQPNMPDATVRSIMQGLPYPEMLLSACIRRIRAEQSVTISRAAIIKACLNRQINNQNKIMVMLDKENTNQGYLCGRLFAALEYLQERANNIHSIRDRYLNAASSTPSAVFATLLNLSVHHVEKLEKGGQIFFENLKSEILGKISPDGFPSHLDLNDQGRFFVGYYHQMQSFYTKKSEEN